MTAATAGGEPALVAGDTALIGRLLAESGVDRGLPEAEGQAWLAHLGKELVERVATLLSWGFEGLARQWEVWEVVAAVAVLLAAIALTWRLVQWLGARRRRRVEAGPERQEAAPRLTGSPADPAAWRLRLERRLEEGRLAEALEALWWWLATSLAAGAAVDPAWTNRELLERAAAAAPRRLRLAPHLARFDRLAYGPGDATADEVRELVAALESDLA